MGNKDNNAMTLDLEIHRIDISKIFDELNDLNIEELDEEISELKKEIVKIANDYEESIKAREKVMLESVYDDMNAVKPVVECLPETEPVIVKDLNKHIAEWCILAGVVACLVFLIIVACILL